LYGFSISASLVIAQAANFSPVGSEYSLSSGLVGDQMNSKLTLGTNGGWIVWEDNAIDGNGLGIGALALQPNLSGGFSPIKVNSEVGSDQNSPEVVVLTEGETMFGWLSGRLGSQTLKVRALSSGGFSSEDVSIGAGGSVKDFSLVASTTGGAWIAWTEDTGDSLSGQNVFLRELTSSGATAGDIIQLNSTTVEMQRDVKLGVQSNGDVLALWVNQSQVGQNKVNIVGRWIGSSGTPLTGEFAVSNSEDFLCGDPALAVNSDGLTLVTWVGMDLSNANSDSWDIYCTAVPSGSSVVGEILKINQFTQGNQVNPSVSMIGDDAMVVWQSMGQDGDREGIFGSFIDLSLNAISSEFQVSTTAVSQQLDPTVSNDGNQFLVAWSSFVGGNASFEILSQRYGQVGPQIQVGTPFVAAMDSSRLTVSWPSIDGFEVEEYLVYVDGAKSPIASSVNFLTVGGFAPGSAHTFRIGAKVAGNVSVDISPEVSGVTYGSDSNFDGIPDDWQAAYWSGPSSGWPAGGVDSDGDGASNVYEFLAGTDPMDSSSVLKTEMLFGIHGYRLQWNTQPGAVYEVQHSLDFSSWDKISNPRLALDSVDSVSLNQIGATGYFRVVRLR
jgi:hypothetical protein